ncbi:MAG: hypothetical protein AAGJ83_12435, partial [Planctomycetota bacterium]
MSRRHVLTFLAWALFACGVIATAVRTAKDYQTPGPFDPSAQGLCDFHNGIYFPTRALLDGVSPYGNEYAATNPVARQIPFFSPGILVLHSPFAVMPLRLAEIMFFCFSVVLLIAIARLSARIAIDSGGESADGPSLGLWTAGLATLLVFSRGGHITLFNGY